MHANLHHHEILAKKNEINVSKSYCNVSIAIFYTLICTCVTPILIFLADGHIPPTEEVEQPSHKHKMVVSVLLLPPKEATL